MAPPLSPDQEREEGSEAELTEIEILRRRCAELERAAAAADRAETALRESEERGRRFFQMTSEGVWCYDLETPIPVTLGEQEQAKLLLEGARITKCNDAFARQYGFERAEDVQGRCVTEFMTGSREEQMALARQFIRSGYRLTDLESLDRDRDGQRLWMLNTVLGIVEGGYLVWCCGIQRDITGRKQAEEALSARTRQLEALRAVGEEMTRELGLATLLRLIARRAMELVRADLSLVFLWNESAQVLVPEAWHGYDGAIETWLRGVRLCLGEAVAGLAAQRRTGMIVNDYRASPHAYPALLDQLNVTAALAEPLLYRDRLVGVLLMNHTEDRGAFTGEDREIVALFAAQATIAIENARLFGDLGRSYRELRQAQDELVRSEKLRALGQMAAGIAHDLNNILGVVLGRVEMMRLQLLPPEAWDGLRALEMAARDGVQVVRRLQDFGRQRTRSLLLPVRLEEIAREAVEITRPRWEGEPQRRGLTIRVDADLVGLPPVRGHAAEIREALTNLILNAVDAMPHGGTLALCGEPAGEWVNLFVKDTGIGMSEEIQARVFEPFFSTKGGHGTGLGLSVVYGIMERHGGSVHVDSRPGNGSTFVLRFMAAPPGAQEARAPATVRAAHAARSLRVLVIDDDEPMLETTVGLLRAAGHRVAMADGGARGLALLAEERFELVLTDLGMPGMTGWDVARAVRTRHPGVPVILLTGWDDAAIRDTPEAGLVDRVLGKPVAYAELLAAILDVASDGPAGSRSWP